jgi:rRNA processing protein Krr1/Pno1
VAHEAKTRTFEFDQEATGILVGRGGATIRQLQSDYSVRIDINSNANPAQARVRADGGAGALDEALEAMKKLLEEAGYGENVTTEDMPIAREHIGSVVGEAGSVVRQLEDDSKCQIRIRKDDRGGVVSIRGNPDAIEVAKVKIAEIIAEREAAEAVRQEELQRARDEAAALNASNAANNSQQDEAASSAAAPAAPTATAPEANPRYIPGAGAQWNKEAEEGFSMSSTAQKNRRKRERRKAAAKSNDKKELAKQDSYQHNLQQLLFAGDGGVGGFQQPALQQQQQQSAPMMQQQKQLQKQQQQRQQQQQQPYQQPHPGSQQQLPLRQVAI